MNTLVSIEMDDDIEETSEEVDALFDYMEERVEQGSDPAGVIAALVVVLALVASESGETETIH